MIVGMATTDVSLTYWGPATCNGIYSQAYWHCDEGNNPNNQGIDMVNNQGPTGGANVYFQAYGYSGYAFGYITDHQYGLSLCPGADIRLWIPVPDAAVGTWIGTADFVQINVTQAWGTEFRIGDSWTLQYLGNVVNGPGTGGCESSDPHLHQSGLEHTYNYMNLPVAYSGRITPTGDTTNNFLHRIVY